MGITTARTSLTDILRKAPKNIMIQDCLTKAYSVLSKYDKVVCAISGGSDSDVCMDLLCRIDTNRRITYVWVDTGLEYQATKDHLEYLETRYEVDIVRIRGKRTIPLSCRTSGVPFINKEPVSEYIHRLQKHQFHWEDASYEELIYKYPSCRSALKWWCNENGDSDRFNINRKKKLKEFLIEHPPTFSISSNCCSISKKRPMQEFIINGGYQLSISGIRKAEGGIRSTAYKGCFTQKKGGISTYRPLFWLSNADKEEYCDHYGVLHSRCYTEYGLTRTGCAGCPFARNCKSELHIMKQYEPKLYKAAINIFGEAYAYTELYNEYQNSGGITTW